MLESPSIFPDKQAAHPCHSRGGVLLHSRCPIATGRPRDRLCAESARKVVGNRVRDSIVHGRKLSPEHVPSDTSQASKSTQ
mmetsp:Transcript_33303/g.64871  ORF Transcript_33303/g.64871 Transcript_33303/m.64871 type:complete len:81 (-) Transcript_33303:326-568(-)